MTGKRRQGRGPCCSRCRPSSAPACRSTRRPTSPWPTKSTLQRLYLDIEKVRFPERLQGRDRRSRRPRECPSAGAAAPAARRECDQIWSVGDRAAPILLRIAAIAARHAAGCSSTSPTSRFPNRGPTTAAANGVHEGTGRRPRQCLPAARSPFRRRALDAASARPRMAATKCRSHFRWMPMTDAYRLRVLLADDEPLAPSACSSSWRAVEGVDLVGSASDGEATVRLAEALNPTCCLLDIAMPGLDGIEVARALGRAKAVARRRVRHRVRPVRGRGVRDRGGRLSDEAGRSGAAAARDRPRARLRRQPRRAAPPRPADADATGSTNSGRRTSAGWCASPRATSTGSRPNAITCGSTSAGAAG